MRTQSICLMLVIMLHGPSGFAQWVQMDNPHAGQVYGLVVVGENLFAATSDNGMFLSTDNGASWKAANTGLTNRSIRSLHAFGTNLYAGTLAGAFRSTTGGEGWAAIGLSNTSVLAFALADTNLFAGTSQGVFFSADDGANWVAVNSGLTNTQVTTLAAAGSHLFVGTFGGVFSSTDNGSHWVTTSLGKTPTSMILLDSRIMVGTLTGAFLSTDTGASWATVNYGLTNTTIFDLAMSGTNLYAGTFGGGVYLSGNSGASWTAANAGLANLNVYAFGVSGTYLFAATEGGGVWRRPLSELIASTQRLSSDLPVRIGLEQNYPNPFNPSTTIPYALPHASYVTLRIYNSLGQVVSTLVDESKTGGAYTVQFDATGLAGGVYLCRMQAGSFTDTKRLLLIK